jgi:hypothetical protein
MTASIITVLPGSIRLAPGAALVQNANPVLRAHGQVA